MARINIEGGLFTRGEWLAMVEILGSADTALGALVRTWLVAQRYWFPNRELIPLDVWRRERLNQAVIESGLAEVRTDGIYVRGSDVQFAWLFDASEKGKKSAEARKKKNGTAQPGGKKRKSSAKNVEHGSNTVGTEPEPLRSSLLSSPFSSSLLSSHHSISNTPPEGEKTSGFIAGYCARFKSKYGFNTKVAGKNAGIAKRVFENIPAGKLDQYLDAFFEMPDAELVKAKHPLAKFEFKFNEVAVFAEKRAFTPRAQASDVDREQADQLKEARERREREEALQGVFGGPMLIGGGDAG